MDFGLYRTSITVYSTILSIMYLVECCLCVKLRLPHVSLDVNQLNFGRANRRSSPQQVSRSSSSSSSSSSSTCRSYLTVVVVGAAAVVVSFVGVLPLRARRPGIRYLTVFATQHRVSSCLGVS